MLSPQIGAVSDLEIVETLTVLAENKLVFIDQYRGSQFVPYDSNEGTAFFYRQDFRCRALPRARRRQQELARGNRHGVFISHIGEERPIALRIQRLLGEALAGSVPVFVSSDYKSILSGEPWYAAILSGLRRSQAIISLLSPSSIDRRWINFEAGIGMGQESKVMPVVWRGLRKGDVEMPLGHLQVRDLHDCGDLKALLQDLATVCRTTLNEAAVLPFLEDLPGLEVSAPSKGLSASLFREGRRVRVAIHNTGTRVIELLEAEILIPETLSNNNNFQEYQPVLQRRSAKEGGVRYVGNCLTTNPSTFPHLGVNPLRPMLAPETEYVPEHLGVNLPDTLSPEDEASSIRCTVSAKQYVFGPIATPICKIPRRDD
jgi:hypothetical protein